MAGPGHVRVSATQYSATITGTLMPITWSVFRQLADAILAAEAAGLLRGE